MSADHTRGNVEILDPRASNFGERTQSSHLAARPDSLEGKTLGLLWNGKPNGDVALKHAAARIAADFPDLTVNLYTGAMPSDRSLLEQAATEADAVIALTAD